jgi:peptide/nickel transport system substrate-binding protein
MREPPDPPRRRAHRRGFTAAVAGVLLVAAACGSGGDPSGSGAAASAGSPGSATAGAPPAGLGVLKTNDPQDGSGGTLRIAMSAGNIPWPATPPSEGYEGYRFVGNNIYDGLTQLNLDQSETIPTPQPALATSWDVSPDLTTWTFHLRDGVKFQDGTPFDADAVIFQFERMKNPDFQYYDKADAARYGATFRYFKSWEKVDGSTVRFTMIQPYGWTLYDLLTIYFPSPTVVMQYGNDNYNQHAVGTGKFEMTKYVDGETMELTANPDYWGGKPKLDKIILTPQPEAASRLSALQSGEVDWAEVPSPDAVPQLQASGFQVMMGKYPHGIMPRFNLFREPFKDNVKLRQALNYALDREGTAALINDVGYPAKQYVYEGHPDFATDTSGYAYDPEKAKQLLAEAGYKPGQLKLKMAYTTGGSGNMFPGPMMEKLQADFKAIGVDVELMPMEWNTLITVGLDGLDKPQWKDIDILWASPAAGMLPTGYNVTFLSTRPGDQPNAAGLNDPQIDAAYNAAMQAPTAAESHADIQKMMKIAVDQAYFLFWMHDLNLRVLSPKVHGYVQPQSWWVDFSKIWVER